MNHESIKLKTQQSLSREKMKKKYKQQNKTKENNFSNILDFIKKNKIFIILFLISTTYFVHENVTTTSWDLNVFVLNAQSIFTEGTYLEVGRPPLPSIILGILGMLFGWIASEIIFVIITSALFAYAIHKLSQTLKFNPTVFYALTLNIYVFTHGLTVGTEILSLSLLIMAMVLIIKNNALSGLFIALTGLTRYNALILFPLSLFHFKYKKIITSLIIFGLTITAWLTYNYIVYGNMFESIANQYALNVISRAHFDQPIQIMHFVQAINILIPFFIYGIIIKIKQLIKDAKTKKKQKQSLWKKIKEYAEDKKPEILMIIILLYTIINYATTPLKIPRYLFFIVLPATYFAYIGLRDIIQRINKNKKTLLTIALIIFTISLASMIIFQPYRERITTYERSTQILEELNVSHCQLNSNVWPHMSYLGIPTSPAPKQELVKQRIEEGHIIHLFKTVGDPDYVFDEEYMQTLPILHEDQQIYIIGKEDCKEAEPVIHKYLEEIKESTTKNHGYEPNTNPCFIMFRNQGFMERTCNFIHGEGFTQDQNRRLW